MAGGFFLRIEHSSSMGFMDFHNNSQTKNGGNPKKNVEVNQSHNVIYVIKQNSVNPKYFVSFGRWLC